MYIRCSVIMMVTNCRFPSNLSLLSLAHVHFEMPVLILLKRHVRNGHLFANLLTIHTIRWPLG